MSSSFDMTGEEKIVNTTENSNDQGKPLNEMHAMFPFTIDQE
jgi:hypothetical protein